MLPVGNIPCPVPFIEIMLMAGLTWDSAGTRSTGLEPMTYRWASLLKAKIEEAEVKDVSSSIYSWFHLLDSMKVRPL